MLLCAVRKYEVYRLTQLIKEIDIDAFIIIEMRARLMVKALKKTEKRKRR